MRAPGADPVVSPEAEAAPEERRHAWTGHLGILVPVGAVAAVVLFGVFTTDGFLTAANLKAIMFTGSFVGIAAISATVIMLSGNLFSLSLGTTISVCAISFLSALHMGLFAATVLTLLLGMVIFAIQGFVVGRWGANPIIVTIAAGSIQLGIVTKLTAGSEIGPSGTSAAYKVIGEPLLGVPFSFYVLVALTLFTAFLLHGTSFGRVVYLMGENLPAATAAAMRVAWVTVAVFGLAGLAAATAGIVLAGFNGTATMSIGGSYTYEAIAASLVGGSAIQGGRGSVWRAFFGAFFIAAVSNLLLLRGYSTGMQTLVEGIAVVVAVVLMRISSLRPR